MMDHPPAAETVLERGPRAGSLCERAGLKTHNSHLILNAVFDFVMHGQMKGKRQSL